MAIDSYTREILQVALSLVLLLLCLQVSQQTATATSFSVDVELDCSLQCHPGYHSDPDNEDFSLDSREHANPSIRLSKVALIGEDSQRGPAFKQIHLNEGYDSYESHNILQISNAYGITVIRVQLSHANNLEVLQQDGLTQHHLLQKRGRQIILRSIPMGAEWGEGKLGMKLTSGANYLFALINQDEDGNKEANVLESIYAHLEFHQSLPANIAREIAYMIRIAPLYDDISTDDGIK